jgi:hypothetical protein
VLAEQLMGSLDDAQLRGAVRDGGQPAVGVGRGGTHATSVAARLGGGRPVDQSLAGSGLASLMASGVAATLSVPLPALVTSTSAPASST